MIDDPKLGIFRFAYDAMDRRTELKYPNGVTTNYTYDNAYRLTAMLAKSNVGEILDAWSYQYDAVGNRLSKTDLAGKTETYTYDEVDRLTKATYTDGSLEGFTYDPAGNRLTRTDEAGNVTTYSYDIANQLTSAGTDTYAYDANGSVTSKVTPRGTTTFTYDFNNRLTSIGGFEGTETNQYAADGIRTQAAGTAFENQTRGIVYDLTGNPIMDLLAGNPPPWIYRVYGPGIDEPLGEWRNSGNRKTYLHRDALGSVTLVSTDAGAAAYRSTYRAFGAMTRTPDPAGTPTRLGYTSREIASGSYMNYRSRYYETSAGRFLQQDSYRGSEVVPPSLHRYTYVDNNPVKYTDPSGGSIADAAPYIYVLIDSIIEVAAIITALMGGAAAAEAIASGGALTGGLVLSALVTVVLALVAAVLAVYAYNQGWISGWRLTLYLAALIAGFVAALVAGPVGEIVGLIAIIITIYLLWKSIEEFIHMDIEKMRRKIEEAFLRSRGIPSGAV